MTKPGFAFQRVELLRMLGVAVAYCLTSWLVIHYFSPNGVTSIFFLASGVALAALLIGGKRYVWAVFLGSLAAELLAGDVVWAGALKAGGAALGALLGAWLINRNGSFDISLPGVRSLAQLGAGGAVGAALSAAIGATSLLLSGAESSATYLSSMREWWVGDTLGVFLMAPLLLVWWPRESGTIRWPSLKVFGEAVLILGLASLAAGIVFLEWGHRFAPESLHALLDRASRGHGLFLFLIWSAIRLGPRGTSVLILLVAAISVTGTYAGTGPFAAGIGLAPSLGIYWFYVVTLSWVGMMLATYIAASKRLTQSLREKEAYIANELDSFLRTLDEHAIVTATDLQGNITSVNDKFCEISGYSREELLGQNHRILNSGLHPREYFKEMYQTISSGKVWHGEVRNRAKDGHFYWVQATVAPVLDDDGKPRRYIAIRTDITAQRLAEKDLADRTRSLLHSEKMASVGQLAAGVAHEINNPIGFVNSNLGTLDSYVEDLLRLADAGADTEQGRALRAEIDFDYLRSDVVDLLAESHEGLERVRKIVANLKDFSHVGEENLQMSDLIAGLESTLNVVWHELKYKVDIMRDLTPLPLVCCNPAEINQVFMNLLVNAGQAIAEQGVITLRCGHGDGRIWIEIADTGCGMDEATRNRMFDPFFTTKPVGIGTGLGMSITWDIVQKHKGSIMVDSAPGQGSCFRLSLPVAGPGEVGILVPAQEIM